MNQTPTDKEREGASRRTLHYWAFNPFRFVAGYGALVVGLVAILLAAFIGSFAHAHFDGVLDIHFGTPAPRHIFLLEGLIDWLCMSLVLLLFALLFARSSFRIIDVLGTQALSRWPTVITAVAVLPPGGQRYAEYLIWRFTKLGPEVTPHSADIVFFCLMTIVTLLMIVWMVALMYRAYVVSCNIKGPRAVGTFVTGLIAAEVASKAAILWLLANS